MARDLSLLLSSSPSLIAPANVLIGHVQLRDLIICPKEAGIVNYVQRRAIVEQNLRSPGSPPRTVADLGFTPNSLTSLPIGTNDVLLAAGGQEADIHISYHTPSSNPGQTLKSVWSINEALAGSINNSVLLTSLNLTTSNQSSVEPRIAVSNNDCTVRFYDVPIWSKELRKARRNGRVLDSECGSLKLDVPVNHSSISPDGRMLLSVGDSNKVYFHSITGGGRITFSPIVTLPLPPVNTAPFHSTSSLAASFSTAFSANGMKFAVASQEGMVAVWDVRSTKPMKVFQTDKSRGISTATGNGNATGWLSDDPWEWARANSRAPGWSVRNVKFGGSSGGKEIMTFTEHTSLVHVVDASTFETEEIIQVPTANYKNPPPTRDLTSPPSASTPSASPRRFLQPPMPVSFPMRNFSAVTGNSVLTFVSHAPRSPSPRNSGSASSPSPRLIVSPPPTERRSTGNGTPRTPAFAQALEDTFRITSYSPPASIGDSTWMPLSGFGARRLSDSIVARQDEEERERLRQQDRQQVPEEPFEEDLVVIPDLGDRDAENQVHDLLQIHGLSTRQSSSALDTEEQGSIYEDDEDEDDEQEDREDRNTGSTTGDYEYRMGQGRRRRVVMMEVDETEPDCLSSRASSPGPLASQRSRPTAGASRWLLTPHDSRVGSPATRTAATRSSSRMDVDEVDEREELEEKDDYASCKDNIDVEYVNDLDLAGVCFDPSGQRLYAASTSSVVEWSIRGSEKTWWSGGEWN
ncbi:hypothetical protein BKA70DRAFT_1370005 [Coprinopsis sp. MPI-PUGE-AT-0042]|nr:hypothetical protein BKA70DRAFT_1370005 [Coprinopsis sp. MPI-PUGE-AT-0042]